jgi:hypothetical protein
METERPNIQIDDEVREMTDEEYAESLASGWTIEGNAEEQLTANMRNQRNLLLKESDWTQIADSPVDKQAWAEYRQTLRDFPATWTPSETVEFPDTPEEWDAE